MLDPIAYALARRSAGHGPLMLMYHSVTADRQPDWPWAVSLDRFGQQLDLLSSLGYRTATMDDIAAGRTSDADGPVAVITFDDGYEDNLLAVEALARRGMTATWFIVSGAIGDEPHWPYDGRPAGRMMDAAALRGLSAAGIEIGSHTVSHCRLTEASDADLARELADSKSTLEDILGRDVRSFAYPYGDWDTRCAEAVRAAGYRQACTTRTGWALRDGNPYTLRRLTVFNHDTASTLCRKLVLASNDGSLGALSRYMAQQLRARLT
ncbi:MAG: polysaccharide deacetylase family protein [Methyloversatilis sp.]|nr:polysaccharide deacetylase family protein [Methyloversatilis sp.]